MAQKEMLTRRQAGRVSLIVAVVLAAVAGAYCLYWHVPWVFDGSYRVSAAQMQDAKEKAAWLLRLDLEQGEEGYPPLPAELLEYEPGDVVPRYIELGGAIPRYIVRDGRAVLLEDVRFPVYVDNQMVAMMFMNLIRDPSIDGLSYAISPVSSDARSTVERGEGCALIEYPPDRYQRTSSQFMTLEEMSPNIATQVMVSDPDIRF